MDALSIHPPEWWPGLLTALATADADELRQRHTTRYTRPAFPGEWWPAQPGADTQAHVTHDGHGGITRRLVLAS